MRLDVARGEPAAVERQDLVVEPLEPALALADDLRLKAPVPIAGRVDLDLPVLARAGSTTPAAVRSRDPIFGATKEA
jgi:hypothetical protein